MEKIYKNKPIKEQFEKLGIAYPYLKSNKKWGLRRSSLLDTQTEEDCIENYLEYLKQKGIIELKETDGYCYRHDYDFEINGESECKYCKEEEYQDNTFDIVNER